MTRIMKFTKTAAVGGLLVIVPIAIVLSVLAQIFTRFIRCRKTC